MEKINYIVECDEAFNPDKSFNLKDTEELKQYIDNLEYSMYKFEIYLCVWNSSKESFTLKSNVTQEFI